MIPHAAHEDRKRPGPPDRGRRGPPESSSPARRSAARNSLRRSREPTRQWGSRHSVHRCGSACTRTSTQGRSGHLTGTLGSAAAPHSDGTSIVLSRARSLNRQICTARLSPSPRMSALPETTRSKSGRTARLYGRTYRSPSAAFPQRSGSPAGPNSANPPGASFPCPSF